jgi:transcriptional regulator with XRE-family HTH domain
VCSRSLDSAAMPKSIYREEHQVLAQLLREMRERAGLTQAELAPRMGRPQNRISDFERGGRRVDLIEFIDYCDVLERDPTKVFTELRRRLSKRNRTERAK